MRFRCDKPQIFIGLMIIGLVFIALNCVLIQGPNNSFANKTQTNLSNNTFQSFQGSNAALDTRTDALIYNPTQIMRVWANFTFENGTAIQGATVGFLLTGPQLEILATKANITDANGISTQSFLIGSSYYDGNYTMYVTAMKGLYNASKILFVWVNASNIEISMEASYLIGDIIRVYTFFRFYNGIPVVNALCGFILRNSTGPLQSKAAFTNSSGIAIQSFGTTNYKEGYYEMYVTGSKDNYTSIANQTFFISAYNGPIIKKPKLTPDPPAYNQVPTVNVSIGVSPIYATITNAILSYYNGTGWFNQTMTNYTNPNAQGFAYYRASIPPHAWNTRVSYKIWAKDSLGNQTWNDNMKHYFNFTIIDPYAPLIGSPIQNDTNILYMEAVKIMVPVTEPPLASSVQVVILGYWTGAGWTNVTMVRVSGTNYNGNWNGTIPAQAYGIRVAYRIFARDFAGNMALNNNGGNFFNYTVRDPYAPIIGTPIQNDTNIVYTEAVKVMVPVTEPLLASGVQAVTLSYWTGAGWTNVTMIRVSGTNYNGNWNGTIPAQAYGIRVAYRIFARDFAGNTALNNNGGNFFNYTVQDPYAPIIGTPIQNDTNIAYTEAVKVMVQVTEPLMASGVQAVTLSYWTGAGWTNITMVRVSGTYYNGNWNGTIPAQAYGIRVAYRIFTRDFAGNMALNNNGGNYFNYTIKDFWEPSISQIEIKNAPIAYDMVANITCHIVEPQNAAGADLVILRYFNGSVWRNQKMSLYNGTNYNGYYSGLIPKAPLGTIVRFLIRVNDTAGNTRIDDNSSHYYSYHVVDYLPPNAIVNLRAEVFIGTKAINLSWSRNTELDLKHYQIHRSLTAIGFKPNSTNNIYNTTITHFLDTSLINGVQYFYIVVAVDWSQKVSNFTKIVNGTPTNIVNKGDFVKVYPYINTRLVITNANIILDFIASNSFELCVNTLSSASEFPDHVLLMNFYINITTIGNPGTVNGIITLTLNSSLESGLDMNNFAIYYWDGASWNKLDSIYYADNHSISATFTHFSIFAPFAVTLKPVFPNWLIYLILIGAVAGVATVVILAKRKKVAPKGRIIEQINKKGRIRIDHLAKEVKMDQSALIDTILKGIGEHQLRGFFADKKKEFITIDFLKTELKKILEGE